MLWVPASYVGNLRRVDSRLSLVVRSLTDYPDSGAPAGERLATSDVLTRLRSRPLKVDDHDGLEGLSLSVVDVRPVAPLLHGLDGGGCQGSLSLDQPHALNLAGLIDDRLEHHRSFRSPGARFDGIFRLNGVSQPFLGALGRENDCAVLSWQLGQSRGSGVLFAVAGFASIRLGENGCCRWRRNCRAWSRCRLDRSGRRD